MIYNFCGETKGKTSSALGTIMRSLGNDKSVRVVFFMKHWETSETQFLTRLAKLPDFDIKFYKAGDNDFIFVDEQTNHTTMENAKKQLQFGKVHEKDESDVKHAQMGYMKALSYVDEKPFLLVLDEANMATSFGLISAAQIRNLVEKAKVHDIHIVLTGRNPPEELIDISDLVTEMKKIKHPFDKGVYAVKGLDY